MKQLGVLLALTLTLQAQSPTFQYEPVRPPWHQVAVVHLSVSGDGKTAVSLAGDGDLAVWNVSDRTLKHRWHLATRAESLALSPDGALLAVSADGTLWLHDTRTGAGKKLGQSGAVLAYAPNGDLFAGGPDGAVKVWRSGAVAQTLPGNAPVTALCPRGEELVVGYGELDVAQVKRWDLKRGVVSGTLPPAPPGQPHAPVRGFSYSPDGNYLAGHTEFGCLIWETRSSHLVGSLEVERGDSMAATLVRSAAFGPRDLYLVTVGGLERVQVPSGKRLQVTPLEHGVELLHPQRDLLLTGNRHGALTWTTLSSPSGAGPAPTRTGCESMAFQPGSSTLLSGHADGKLWIWNASTALPQTSRQGHTKAIHGVVVRPDGTTLTASADGTVKLWERPDAAQGRVVLQGPTPITALSVQGELAAVARGNAVTLFQLPDGKPVAQLQGHSDLVTDVAVSPDRKFVASVSEDGTVRLWNPDGTQRSIAKSTAPLTAVAISPDSRLVATTQAFMQSSPCRVWDAATAKPLYSLEDKDDGGTLDVAFSADGSHVFVATVRASARVWRLADRTSVSRLPSYDGYGTAIAVSSDDTVVATRQSGNEDSIRFWARGR